MESPVRICLGAALVVHLLLLSSATVEVNALPEATATTLKNERLPRFSKVNGTSSVARNRSKTPDVALNELNPKDTTSEEHSEKNAKYKDRGRFRFGSRSSTESPRRRVTQPPSTEASKIMIVTPTPPQKNLSQIIDSMREFKKTKIPAKAISTTPISLNDLSSSNPGTSKATITESPKQSLTVSVKSSITVAPSSSTPLNIVKKDVSAQLEEYEDEDEEEEKEAFEKFTSSKFHDDFFTIPSFGDDDDFTQDSTKDATNNKVHSFFSTPSFPKYSTYFPEKISHSSKEDEEDEDVPFKASSFFRGFESDLTTPKNDFFDKKFQEISSSIIKNLASVKVKTPAPNTTNLQKIVKENVGLKKVTDGTPTNKSSVFIKNTKEIRLLDNEGAGTANKELSDVHGTSIYYEMSVLSTETYAIDHSDGDCENDTSPFETVPTPSTTNDEELAPLKSTAPTLFTIPTKTDLLEPKSTVVSTFTPISSSISSVKSSSQNSILSTEKTSTRIYTSSYSSRNRGYKRLNFTGTRDPNSVTVRPDQVTANQFIRPVTRFHYTTPKAKPIWMSPRRNGTARPYQRSTVPTTIYSEHFSIKEKSSTTPRPNRQPNRPSILTTVSSDIDPVLQSDVGGIKKIVHSQSISDNSIPTLWKRGSTKFGASTVAPQEQISEMEIPPTLTAWALASLRIPPSMASPAVANGTSTTKSDDENELQKVGELTDKKESMIASSTTSTTTGNINDFTSKIISEIDQNKLPWRPVYTATSPTPDVLTETTTSEAKSAETQPAESNISAQSSVEQIISTPTKTSESNVTVSDSSISNDESSQSPSWVPVTTSKVETTSTEEMKNASPTETITPTKSTRFESITKLPAGVTTPQGDEIISKFSEKPEIITEIRTEIGTQSTPTTTDYEITTITFPDKLTQATEDSTEAEVEQVTTPVWHPVVPTRTRITTLKDTPVTTYRPHYITTTDESEETTTDLPETTSMKFEVSSSVERATRPPKKSQPIYTTTEEVSTTSTEQETSTTVEIITEINTQRGTSRNQYTTKSMPDTTIHVITTTDKPTDTSPSNLRDVHNSSEENSGSNEVVTQETKATSTTTPTSLPTQTPTKAKMPTEEQNEILELSTAMPLEIIKESTTVTQNGKYDTTMGKDEPPTETTTDFMTTKSVNELEDLTSYAGEVTTESSSRVLTTEEAGSGAAVAIAVSTIGVIALILLVGLLLVVRRRGRRGVYAQRCTPVSLDAYSLDSVSVGQRKGNQRLRASKRSYGNPAFDDEVTSHPMQFAALASFALDVESMSAEFGEIPAAAARPDAVPAGCEDKNRYSNVLPLPETRVPLQQLANDPASTYIHANYVTGPGNIKNYYIACQAPLPNTVVDVWRMVWEQNSRLIVMLTEYMENGVEKCFEYLPPSEISDNKRTFGDFQIILKKREAREKYAVSTVQLINLRTRTWREITHLWYFWPAKGVPEDFDSIIDFLSEMRGSMKIAQTAKEYDEEGVEVIYGDQSRASFGNMSRLRDEAGSNGHGLNVYSPQRAEEAMRRGNNGTLGRMKTASEIEGVRPCVVMCASGAGRAAAMIALDICARALAAGAVDVPRVVRELRAQRPHALANKHHYIFLYRVLSEYGNKLMGGGVDTI